MWRASTGSWRTSCSGARSSRACWKRECSSSSSEWSTTGSGRTVRSGIGHRPSSRPRAAAKMRQVQKKRACRAGVFHPLGSQAWVQALRGSQALPDRADAQRSGMQDTVHFVDQRRHTLRADLHAEDAFDELFELPASDFALHPTGYFHNHSPARDRSPSSTAEVYTEVKVT
jgi:hypothetical protein